MGVDTSLQYNGYNSYKFNQNDFLICYPFGVENMEYITHSFGAYSPIALSAKVRAYTRFFNADGEEIKLENHSFAVQQGTFDKVEITVSVPASAVKAELKFLNNEAQPWWVATPKTEEGQTATPYAINAYGQLTYITPNGIYTGTITANQIVLASGNESLTDRLVTINANQIALESEVVKKGVNYAGTKITAEQGFENTAIVNGQEIKIKANAQEGFSIYSNGVFVGGVTIANGEVGLTAKRIGTSPQHYGEIGITGGLIGLALYDLNYGTTPFAKIVELSGGSGFGIIDSNEIQRFSASDISTYIKDGNGTSRFYARDTSTYIRDGNGIDRFYATLNHTNIIDSQNNSRLYCDTTSSSLMSPDGSCWVEVYNNKIEIWVNGVMKESWS